MPKILCVIPARGGSKRLPKKNILDFFGKPMIYWTIEAAKKSKIFDKIVVSTDDERIKKISLKFGAEVPFMREGLSDDYTPISQVTCAYVKKLKNEFKYHPDIVVQLMANCPNRSAKEIRSSIKFFLKNKLNFQLSCLEYGFLNPWWALKINKKNIPKFLFPKEIKKRSQDLEKLFCPSGAIWIAKTSELLRANTFYGKGHKFKPLPWYSAIDIDDKNDLEIAKIANKTYLRSKEYD